MAPNTSKLQFYLFSFTFDLGPSNGGRDAYIFLVSLNDRNFFLIFKIYSIPECIFTMRKWLCYCVVSQTSWANLALLCCWKRFPLLSSSPLSPPSASPQPCWLWHLSDTSQFSSLNWHKAVHTFAGFIFCQFTELSQLKKGAAPNTGKAVGNVCLGYCFWQQQAAKTAWASCETHPKGIALPNRLTQIMTLLLQKEMGSSSHPISH